MLATRGKNVRRKRNVSFPEAVMWRNIRSKKIKQPGGKVVASSGSNGYIYDEEGIDEEEARIRNGIENVRRGRISEYTEKYDESGLYTCRSETPTIIRCGIIKRIIAFPGTTQNEVNGKDTKLALKNGVYVVAEGANMPTTLDGVAALDAKILYGPGKAAKCWWCGNVQVWKCHKTVCAYREPREGVDNRLRQIMKSIHKTMCGSI